MILKLRGPLRIQKDMPSKPDRYGIKFYILVDAENLYCQHENTCHQNLIVMV